MAQADLQSASAFSPEIHFGALRHNLNKPEMSVDFTPDWLSPEKITIASQLLAISQGQ